MSQESVDSATDYESIEPFAPDWDLPYDSLIVNLTLFGFIGLSHLGYTSIWWAFLLLAIYLLPPEMRKVYEHGFERYASAIGFKRPDRRDVSLYFAGLMSIVGVLFGILYVTVTIATAITGISPSPPTSGGHLLAQATFTPEIYVGAVILMFVLIGPEEEFLFRDRFVGWLQPRIGRWKGITVGNIVFSLAHLPVIIFIADAFWMTVPFVVLFAVGSLLSIQYEFTENLLVPSMTHATYNSIILTVLFVSQSAL